MNPSPWARLRAELADDLDSAKVLLVGPVEGREQAGVELSDFVSWDPAAGELALSDSFDLVVCARAIEASPHPANLLTELCAAMVTGGKLFLHSRVLTDPKQSAYARFVGGAAGIGDAEWVPGRLALRWTVETNGFDVERWIDAGPSEARGEGDAYLVATRTDRTPSLVLGTPHPVDGPSQTSEDS